jgi:GNAT superfamily N-acetyltransferase
MQIRFYKDGDLEEAKPVFVDLAMHYQGDSRSSNEAIGDNLENNILGPHSDVKLILAFDENNKALGLATISLLYPAPNECAQLFVKDLFVSPRSQGQGVGREIMRFIASYAQTHNCSRLDLTVETDNPDALRFYEALGLEKLQSKFYMRAETAAIEKLAGKK